MKKSPLVVLLVLSVSVSAFGKADAAKGGTGRNVDMPPPDVSGFHGEVMKDVVYGKNLNWQGEPEELKLDVYRPEEATAGHPLPLYVWIHGGAYSVGDKKGSAAVCQAMAAKGFVVATINYRMGWQVSPVKTENDPKLMGKAAYRALQDAHAAMRFLAAHAGDYGIDTRWIFVGGASAGASISLNLVYVSDQLAEQTQPGVPEELGPLHAASNDLTASYHISGIVDMWGAMVRPDVINQANAVPTLFFHGIKDGTAPFANGHVFTMEIYPTIYGSGALYPILRKLGVSTQLYADPNGGHGVFLAQFRVDRAADFLHSVMRGEVREGAFVGDGEHFEPLALP